MDSVWKLPLAGLLIWWLSQSLEVSKAKCFDSSQYIRKGKPETRFVVGFGRKNLEIFCLGAIISPKAIMTLASCFDETEVDGRMNYNEDYHERRKRKVLGSRQWKNKTRRKRRIWNSRNGGGDREGDAYVNEESPSQFNSTFSDQEGDGYYADDADEEVDDYADDEEQQLVPKEPFSLFRIDPVKRVFVRLTAEALSMMPHPDYNKLKGAYLWAFDVGIAFTNIPFDFVKKKTIRPIRIYIDGFGNYMKSLDEAMMNAEYCHVIGLVEYNDNGSYTPRDTDVELISHHILMDYEDCNNNYCRYVVGNATGSCAGTGLHIFKNPTDPLPYVINGSPLVCHGRLMSVVNVKSQCDVDMFSGDFPSPSAIRHLISYLSMNHNLTVLKELKPNSTFPSIPFPKWRINTGLQQASSCVCISALVMVLTIISL